MAGVREMDVARRRRPRDRKQQILSVATELFVQLGYQAVTMRLIADRVGIQAGALYRHFANKAVLFEAVVRESYVDFTPTTDTATSLTETLAANCAAAVPRRHLLALWSREARHLPKETQRAVRALLRRSTQGYIDLIRAERPEVSAGQAEMLALATQSVLASPGLFSVRLPADDLAAVLFAACTAVCAVDLAATGEREVPVESPLRPVSRRERLLLAAMRLFAQNGYQEATMADIGAAADVTGPNLYAYFENKADVLIAVVERGKNALWLDLGAALAAHSRPPDALEAVVAGTVRLSRNWSSLQAPAIGVPGVESVVKDMWRDYIAEWTGLLRASRPDLDPQRARVLVHAGLTVLDDLARTPHLTSDAAFDQNVALMVLAILYAAT